MITINLLPTSQRPCGWLVRRAAMLLMLPLILLFCGLVIYNSCRIWSLEKQVNTVRQQYELLMPAQEKMQLAVAKQSILQEKHTRLIKITAERKPWSAILAHLGIVTPSQIWFTELKTGEGNVLIIRGNTRTYPDLAAFISILEKDELLGEPVLIKTEQDNKQSFTHFELTVKLKEI